MPPVVSSIANPGFDFLVELGVLKEIIMSARNRHLEVDKCMLKEEFNDVHAWIDSRLPEYRSYPHWLHYHHVDAISEQYTTGSKEHASACLHVIEDFIGHFGIVFLPRDEEELRDKLEEIGVI